MPYLDQKVLDGMLKTLPYDQRKVISDIMHGKVLATVKCESQKCKGRVIAYIYQDNLNDPSKKRVVPSTTDDVSKMFLFQSRPRLDGQWGFHCRCGNNSLLSESEKGTITSSIPTKSDLEIVWKKLQTSKNNYPTHESKQEVDGFTIEETKI